MVEPAANLVADPLVRAILAGIPDPVYIIDHKHRISWCNAFRVGSFQARPSRMIGRQCHNAFRRRSRPCSEDCPTRRVLASGRPLVIEHEVKLPGEAPRWGEIRVYPLPDKQGRVTHTLHLAFDITDRKIEEARDRRYLASLEQALQASERRSEPSAPAVQAGGTFGLTDREIEVLRLLAGGLRNREIASLLDLSPHTVKSHVAHIFNKLGAHNRAQAAALAERNGMI